jgi:hypothetical protein
LVEATAQHYDDNRSELAKSDSSLLLGEVLGSTGRIRGMDINETTGAWEYPVLPTNVAVREGYYLESKENFRYRCWSKPTY